MHRFSEFRNHRARAGFTLVEALVSITVTTVAGSAVLLGISSTLQTTNSVLEQSLAAGMAQQLMDELAGLRYAEPGLGPNQTTLGPEAGETATPTRGLFDDLDDAHGWLAAPQDYWGRRLGLDDGEGGLRHANFRIASNYFDGWEQEVEVYYVSDADMTTRLPAGQTSDHRAVHVRVYVETPGHGTQQLVELKRVFAYVPAP